MSQLTTGAVSGAGLTSYGTQSSESKDNSLGQDAFLSLFMAQLNNQDPTDPVKNEDFVAQLAQFSTVAGIEELGTSFDTLSQTLSQNQTLQAAALVGKKVMVPVSSADLEAGQGASGAVSLSAAAESLKVEVRNSKGEVVRTLDLGSRASGLQEFTWDGKSESGEEAPAGVYEFKVVSTTGGVEKRLSAMLSGEVQSISTSSSASGLTLSVRGLGQVSFSDVYRIG